MYFEEHLSSISDFLSGISKENMSLVLEDIMTPQEIVEISERFQIFKKLKSWQTQRDIASEMWVSVTTVSRGSRVLQFGKKAIHNYL